MKRFLPVLILLSTLAWKNANAQAKIDTSLKLQDIQLTNAPAFSLMDVSPSSIQSPASTKAFAASIVNTLSHSNGIPQNYALEFTPFWFTAHPKFSNHKYFGVTADGKSLPASQIRFFSFSFALINKDSATNVGKLANHNASLGIRATLIRIYGKDLRQKIMTTARSWDTALAGAIHQLNGETPTQEQVDKLADGLKYSDTMQTYLTAKPLFSLDAAAASNMTFDNNSFGSNRINRSGVWVNANLSLDLKPSTPGKNYFTLSALMRYIYSKDSLDTHGDYTGAGLTDIGVKGEFQFGKFSAAYEYIHRGSSNKAEVSTYKSVGLLQYKIRDGIFITGAFGQNFSTINNVITTLGINWGFSSGNEKIQ